MSHRPAALGVLCLFASLATADVIVELDLDADVPGRQWFIVRGFGEGSTRAAVTIRSTDPAHEIWSIGYLGGLDRGIAFGHVPREGNHGEITRFSATAGTPVHSANTGHAFPAFSGAKAFAGWEVQYVEWGADGPAPIAADPPPTFEVLIEYRLGLPCDQFHFYLADFVSIWRQFPPGFPEGGAFSTTGPITLDTGGDARPDQTDTLAGIDGDAPVPVPPAAFRVDYVDGPYPSGSDLGGPAIMEIAWPGDIDFDRQVGIADLATLLSHFGATDAMYAEGDLNGDGAVALDDLSELLGFFGLGCPR